MLMARSPAKIRPERNLISELGTLRNRALYLENLNVFVMTIPS